MQPLKIVLCSHEGEQHFHLLDEVEDTTVVNCPPEAPDELLAAAADMDVFFGKPSVELLRQAPKLKWIQAPSAGVEFVASIPELANADVLLTNTRGAHGPSIGEHAIALLLAMTRYIPDSVRQQDQRIWDRSILYRTCREIGGMTMGLIGFGALGRGVAQRALGMEMEVIAVDAQAVDGTGLIDEVWPASRLDDLLEQSDVVVVTTPYTELTADLIDADRLAKMKSDAYLIVVSRGGIVNEEALVDALKAGRLAGAALDVTLPEPPEPDSPLWDCPKLLLTPHTAGASARKEQRVVEIFVDNIRRFQNGEPLVNLVDKTRGY
ncbi:MAG TPA: D-2-hydroxyacid dehydrogenase [Thermomicrobiales bacterium]|nr:D-2-hydroxyacid dehydrogenase [Thermomicrobiales bacterium]